MFFIRRQQPFCPAFFTARRAVLLSLRQTPVLTARRFKPVKAIPLPRLQASSRIRYAHLLRPVAVCLMDHPSCQTCQLALLTAQDR